MTQTEETHAELEENLKAHVSEALADGMTEHAVMEAAQVAQDAAEQAQEAAETATVGAVVSAAEAEASANAAEISQTAAEQIVQGELENEPEPAGGGGRDDSLEPGERERLTAERDAAIAERDRLLAEREQQSDPEFDDELDDPFQEGEGLPGGERAPEGEPEEIVVGGHGQAGTTSGVTEQTQRKRRHRFGGRGTRR